MRNIHTVNFLMLSGDAYPGQKAAVMQVHGNETAVSKCNFEYGPEMYRIKL